MGSMRPRHRDLVYAWLGDRLPGEGFSNAVVDQIIAKQCNEFHSIVTADATWIKKYLCKNFPSIRMVELRCHRIEFNALNIDGTHKCLQRIIGPLSGLLSF
jgi:hypothetical protein